MKLTINGCGTLDGEYEFDDSYFLHGELHVIKRETQLRPGELSEAIEARDADVAIALAIAGLMRNGFPMNHTQCQLLWNSRAGSSIEVDFGDEEEADARPPDTATPSGLDSNRETPESSGPSTNGSSDQPVSDPSFIGNPGSDTGVTSGSVTSP